MYLLALWYSFKGDSGPETVVYLDFKTFYAAQTAAQTLNRRHTGGTVADDTGIVFGSNYTPSRFKITKKKESDNE